MPYLDKQALTSALPLLAEQRNTSAIEQLRLAQAQVKALTDEVVTAQLRSERLLADNARLTEFLNIAELERDDSQRRANRLEALVAEMTCSNTELRQALGEMKASHAKLTSSRSWRLVLLVSRCLRGRRKAT